MTYTTHACPEPGSSSGPVSGLTLAQAQVMSRSRPSAVFLDPVVSDPGPVPALTLAQASAWPRLRPCPNPQLNPEPILALCPALGLRLRPRPCPDPGPVTAFAQSQQTKKKCRAYSYRGSGTTFKLRRQERRHQKTTYPLMQASSRPVNFENAYFKQK